MSYENQYIEILEEKVCGICLENLENNIYKTICGHIFHDNCIHKSMNKNNCCPYCRKEIQTPSASCIYKIINSAMKEGDYSGYLLDLDYIKNVDEDCYFIDTDAAGDSLYFIMFIFDNSWNCINQNSLLLNTSSYHNNVRFYPKKILKDYREIMEDYGRWEDLDLQEYELNLDTNEINCYLSGNKRKPNSVLLMNKTYEWNLYEKEYEKEIRQNYNSDKN